MPTANSNYPSAPDPLQCEVGEVFPLKSSDWANNPNEFEIGLVLGGTVSAAAFTAGVVDFLIEALDLWNRAREDDPNDPSIPPHKTTIKIMTGTSGGAITCVLLARTLASAFPHCQQVSPDQLKLTNPFYRCWVNDIDIKDLLAITDLKKGRIDSLLCADTIDDVGKKMARYRGAPLGSLNTPKSRDYIVSPMPMVLTLSNLRGIPYSSVFHTSVPRPESYTDFADHVRVSVDIIGAGPPSKIAPFETAICEASNGVVQDWDWLVHIARGSSAFPVGLPPQVITVPAERFLYRYAITQKDLVSGQTIGKSEITAEAVWLRPDWSIMCPGSVPANIDFLAVDGGCFNNEPTEYARQYLAGVLGHNERSATSAHRAVLLVDPFADKPSAGLSADPGLLGAAAATLGAWKSGARFATADLDLFTSEDIYSRFLITPVREDEHGKTLSGGEAIATSCLDAFGGFLSRTFREHDYFLGRRNCQRFLETTFVLDEKNALFSGWDPAARTRFGKGLNGFLPIIPLFGTVAVQVPQPKWPANSFSPDSIKDALETRIAELTKIALTGETSNAPWYIKLLSPLASLGDTWLAQYAIGEIRKSLIAAKLL